MKKPPKKILNRKITIDDIGTTYVVGELSKEDLQILVCVLADDLEELKSKRTPECPVCGTELQGRNCPAGCQDQIY